MGNTLKYKWVKIKEDIKKEIDASDFEQKWIKDPKGYFLIRINKSKKLIEVGHCTNNHKMIHIIKGKTPESIMYKIIDLKYVSLLDHAAYLGKELQKAYLAMKNSEFAYCQDSRLLKRKK